MQPSTCQGLPSRRAIDAISDGKPWQRSEEHTSELQSLRHLVCRLLLEKKKNTQENKLVGHHVCGSQLVHKEHNHDAQVVRRVTEITDRHNDAFNLELDVSRAETGHALA